MTSARMLIEQHRAALSRMEFPSEGSPQCIRLELESDREVDVWYLSRDGHEPRLDREPSSAAAFVVRLGADDFAQHIEGAHDLLGIGSPFCVRPIDGSGETAPSPAPLADSAKAAEVLVRRSIATLALSQQCRPQFRNTELESIYLRWGSFTRTSEYLSMGQWSVPYYVGDLLYELVSVERLDATLEVGLAHGVSAMFIAQAHKDKGKGLHVALDPCQELLFQNCGVNNLERSKLGEYFELIERPNYAGLPQLYESGRRFQLVFIDGLHIFDHVLLDFLYSDLLLEPGGFAVFDDNDAPAVEEALRFILANRSDSYALVEARSRGRATVLVKTREDTRVRDYGETFHRSFGPKHA